MSAHYVELHAHSAFSFGDGAVTPEALVARAAELGYLALALTDSADVGGAIRFVQEAERHGIKPIVGAELKVDGHRAVFLARDEEGYRNLAKLVTLARVGTLDEWAARDAEEADAEGSAVEGGGESGAAGRARTGGGGRPRVEGGRARGAAGRPVRSVAGGARTRDLAPGAPGRGQAGVTWEQVAVHSAGLHALTGSASGEIASLVYARRPEEAAFMLARWRDVFGDRLAVEVQLHHVSGGEAALAAALIDLAKRAGVPWVVTNEPRYLDAGSRLVHDLLTALRAGVDVSTAASWGLLHPNGEWRLKSPVEMAVLWRGREEGLEESARIAAECRAFELRWLRAPLPRFEVPAGHDDDSWLRELVFAGARERWGELDERQRAQLEHELGVIQRLGFAGFFLVMWDAVRFARSRGILCQGRGSAANSAVAYCLGITAVDPVRHGLLFERFLSEVRTDGRAEAPDIDVDFEMHRREEVLNYMYRRYRRQHAAITGVTQVFHGPSAVQDVMRALGYPAELALRLSRRLRHYEPSAAAEQLEGGLATSQGLELGDARGRALLGALRRMDGLPRLRSTHPGGFVLSSEPLGAYLPIEHTTMGRTIIQFDKDDLDAAGVPKFDFLGLGGLSAVHLAFDAIEKRTGEKLELYRLPVDDPKTFAMIAAGDTVGTFQIESRAQIQSILQTRPERLYDLVVQVALIRPGPIQARFVRPYTMRRRGLEPVRYAHPLLEPILRRTYGIPIFQEQAMAISMALGGFSAGEADELRRAMGHQHKLPRLQAALERLKARCIERGVDEAVAAEIVDDLRSFANYGFPESHAWSFALIAYATAYLKAHYPTEFFLGLLNAWPMGFYPPSTLVHVARRCGVTVLGPCVRDGEWDCTIEEPNDSEWHRARARARAGARESDLSSRAGEMGEFSPVVEVEVGPYGEVAVGGPSPSPMPLSGAAGTGSSPRPRPSPSPMPLLRIGLKHIRGLGDRARDALRAARAEGPFTSVEDVVRRARLTRSEALHLARAGAFEAFEPGRRRAAWEALRAAGDLLPLAPAHRLPFDPRELTDEELVFLDYLATGICTDGHPMQYLRERLRAAGAIDSRELEEAEDGAYVVVAGLIVARQHPQTANGTVFVLLEDEHGFINVIVSPPLYARNRETVNTAQFLLIEGRLERDDRVINIIGRRFRRLAARDLVHRSRDFR